MLNDNRLFPGRDVSQVTNLEDSTNEWKAGDHTWLPYKKVKHLEALNTYLEVLGVDSIENLPMGNDEPDTDDPQITVHTIRVEHEATLVSQHVNNMYQLKDSYKKHWKKFRRIVKTLTMDSNGLPVNFFAPNSNVLSVPPERFTEPDVGPITQSWAMFDMATSTSYVFLAAELKKVFEFHRYIETNSIPPDFYALAALPPFADLRHLAEAIQNHFNYSRRKNLALNQEEPLFGDNDMKD
ncbi:hypothetical protein ACEPAI_2839 [Sanghuangporus weigelae]